MGYVLPAPQPAKRVKFFSNQLILYRDHVNDGKAQLIN